jgi:hypothetical protein
MRRCTPCWLRFSSGGSPAGGADDLAGGDAAFDFGPDAGLCGGKLVEPSGPNATRCRSSRRAASQASVSYNDAAVEFALSPVLPATRQLVAGLESPDVPLANAIPCPDRVRISSVPPSVAFRRWPLRPTPIGEVLSRSLWLDANPVSGVSSETFSPSTGPPYSICAKGALILLHLAGRGFRA